MSDLFSALVVTTQLTIINTELAEIRSIRKAWNQEGSGMSGVKAKARVFVCVSHRLAHHRIMIHKTVAGGRVFLLGGKWKDS